MKRLFHGVLVVTSLFAMQVMAEKAGTADLDSDGKVTKEEFIEVRAKMAEKAGRTFDKASTEKQFSTRDVNGDGVLTGEEATLKK